MNKETKKVLSEAQELEAMMKGNGWMIAKKKLLDIMSAYGGILNIEESDPVKLMHLISANQQAIKMIIDWMNTLNNTVNLSKDFSASIKEDLNKMIITSQDEE